MSERTPAPSSPAILHKLARARLGAAGAVFPPQTSGPEIRRALALCAFGLRHYEGEHVVAALRLSGSGAAFEGIVLTDRALAWRCGDDRGAVDLAAIEGAERREGLFDASVSIKMRGGQVVELPIEEQAEAVEGLLVDLVGAGYAPAGRAVPALVCGDDDPTGIKHLVGALKAPDDRVVALIQLLFEGIGGALPEAAIQDLAVRVQCLYRNLSYGRGAHEGRWLSPLRQDDLAALLPRLFDRETRTERKGQGFEIEVGGEQGAPRKKAESIERRVIASIIDQVVERTVGDEVYTLFGDGTESLRVTVEDGPGTDALVQRAEGKPASVWSRLKGGLPDLADSLLGRNRRAEDGALSTVLIEGRIAHKTLDLADLKPTMLAELMERLVALEVRALLLRALHGWQAPPEQLLATPDAQLRAALSGRLTGAQIEALLVGVD